MYSLNSYWLSLPAGAILLVAVAAAMVVFGFWRIISYRKLYSQHVSLMQNLSRMEVSEQHLQERLHEYKYQIQALNEQYQAETKRVQVLEQQLVELRTTVTERQTHFNQMQKALEESQSLLKQEFENIGQRILAKKGKELTDHGHSSLETMLRPFREQIEAFQKRANHIHDETLRGNVSLNTEIKRVVEMGLHIGQEASRLSSALHNDKKTVGNWGEVQLERSLQLSGLEPGQHYVSQASFTDAQGQKKQPDFVIYLPNNKHLVIDSKVSLVDYNQAVSASELIEQQSALDAHVRAVRNHINDLSNKNYSNLTGLESPSFVLMFMPIEAAYIEALKHKPEIFDYGLQKNVVMVSHTTLMPVLRTVANLWLILRSNEQAHELSQHAGDIYNQVALMAERLKRLGQTLGTVSRHYNDTVVAVAGQQGLFGKVARFTELSVKASRTLPDLTELEVDFHQERLEQQNCTENK